MRILFVCTGNTCRSPMAQALAQKLGAETGKDLICDSAGVRAFPGSPMAKMARDVLAKVFDIHDFDHTARQITRKDVEESDLVIAMTDDHRTLLIQTFGQAEKILSLPSSVPDPYGKSFAVYQKTAEEILAGLEALCREGIIHD